MLGKLFGKKKSGYFLELSEEEAAAVSEPAAPPAPAAAPAVASDESPVAAEAGDAATAAPKAAAAKPAAVPALPTAISKASEAMPQEAATPQPIADPVELIRTAIASAGNQTAAAAEAEAAKANFDYRAPVAKAPRRRPGPSMSPFKTMAKDMKKTTAGF